MKRHLHLPPPNNKTFHLHSKHQNQKPETEVQSWIEISILAAAISI